MIRGSIVATVTPMKDGKIDFDSLGELVEWFIASGSDGIVPMGTTGESATLTHEEHDQVVAFVVKAVAGRVKVIAGAGSNATHESVRLTKRGEEAGADGILTIQPYYNKPTPEGTYRHFKAVAEATKLPVVLYSVPGRTGREIDLPTIKRLAEIENVVAVKEAGGSVDRATEIVAVDGIDCLSGDDTLVLPMMAVGAVGTISASANVVPREMADIVRMCAAGDFSGAREIHHRIYPVLKELFVENNPSGAKTALKLMGRLNAEVRLPLVELKPENEAKLEKTLRACGVI